MKINNVAAGNAINWFKCGWKIFSSDMVNWVLMAVIFVIAIFLLSFIPLLGVFLVYLILPLMQAGMIYAAKKASEGESINLNDLFAVFKMDNKRGALIALGGIMLATMFVLAIVSVPFVGGAMMSSIDEMPATGAPALPSFGAGGLVFVFIVGILLAMLFFYAPALILLRNMGVIAAIKTSFSAALNNLLPFILFLVIYAVLSVIAAIPFGLGFLVLLPVVMAASYCSYRDIFA
ncbi:MAG: BPSS1780 family membrane protein [Thiolinea sp.]